MLNLPFPSTVIFKSLIEHIDLCLLSLSIALSIAFPLGLIIADKPRLSDTFLSLWGIIYTIPSLAMLALLIPLLGLGKSSAIVALVIYSQFILLRQVVLGLQSVEASSIEAAKGLGLTPLQIFMMLKVPMALPLWINGLRNATLTTLSIATTAAWINAGGLGTLIFEGLSQNNTGKILMGASLISGLALCFDQLLNWVEMESVQIAQGLTE
jgi:osmoprotectant transport system permease protein